MHAKAEGKFIDFLCVKVVLWYQTLLNREYFQSSIYGLCRAKNFISILKKKKTYQPVISERRTHNTQVWYTTLSFGNHLHNSQSICISSIVGERRKYAHWNLAHIEQTPSLHQASNDHHPDDFLKGEECHRGLRQLCQGSWENVFICSLLTNYWDSRLGGVERKKERKRRKIPGR